MFRLYISTALAIFAMFFGAGNVIFPLVLGQLAGEASPIATLGLLLTAIGGPLLGLFGGVLFEGDFKLFFCRCGKGMGYLLMIICSVLLGPLAVMPRCLVVTHAAIAPHMPIYIFSTIIAALIFVFLSKRTRLLPILGGILSPILILLLVLIIAKGFYAPAASIGQPDASFEAFKMGLVTGYDTMDLIASIFFSISIWHLMRGRFYNEPGSKKVLKATFISGAIGGILLALVYVGLSQVSARHSATLAGVAPEQLMISLAHHLLGPLGLVANWAVALACITTIMGLAVTFADIARKDFFAGKVTHKRALLVILGATALFSNLGFGRIMAMIHPVVALCYPAIITLTLCNIAYKLYGWQSVKIPVYATLLATIVFSNYLPI